MFKWDVLPSLKLDRVDTPEGRFYINGDDEWFESVTTVLGRLPGKDYLTAWRRRVGPLEADRIMNAARIRGTIVHDALERYVKNDADYLGKVRSPFNAEAVGHFTNFIDTHIDMIYGCEHMMFSRDLGVAGTADLIARCDGKISIVDYKTARSAKAPVDILHYYLQSACYAMMVRERHDVSVEQVVILVNVDHDRLYIFKKNVDKLVYVVNKVITALVSRV